MKRVVNEFYDNVNFGFMTFGQTKYYPYYEATSAITYSTRETFIPRTQLEFSNCFTTSAGPSASCIIQGTIYTRKATTNSRYRLNKGIFYDTYDYSWVAGCSDDCAIAGVGTGIYEGTYYTYQFATASIGDKREFDDFTGRVRTADGKTYIYLDAHVTKRNENNIHGDKPSLGDPIGSENTRAVGSAAGAVHGHQPVAAAGHGQDHGPEDRPSWRRSPWAGCTRRAAPPRAVAEERRRRRPGAQRLPLPEEGEAAERRQRRHLPARGHPVPHRRRARRHRLRARRLRAEPARTGLHLRGGR